MSDSVRPLRRQPTRLPCPWDPPGKNTGVGCHFLLQYVKVKSESEVTQACRTLSDPMDCSLSGSSVHGIFQARVLEWVAIAFLHGLYSPWNSPGQNTGVCSLSLLQGIFPTQGSNPGLPHCRQILYQLSHWGSPRTLGSPSFLKQVFPSQESNQGFLRCRQILCQLGYEGGFSSSVALGKSHDFFEPRFHLVRWNI